MAVYRVKTENMLSVCGDMTNILRAMRRCGSELGGVVSCLEDQPQLNEVKHELERFLDNLGDHIYAQHRMIISLEDITDMYIKYERDIFNAR